MPRQKGPIILKGTIGEKTYYQMGGEHLVRKKTSLTKERVKAEPAFANSRKSSIMFGKASKLAQVIYHLLPEKKKKHGLIGQLTGKANAMLHAGKKAKDVKAALMKLLKIR